LVDKAERLIAVRKVESKDQSLPRVNRTSTWRRSVDLLESLHRGSIVEESGDSALRTRL
jgi:hypothetical protein